MAVDSLPMDFGRDKPFYVYLYRDPRKGKRNQPIYVGKGTVKFGRADEHWRKGSHNVLLNNILGKIRDAGLTPAIEIVGWFDDDGSARVCEAELIRRIGRRNIGEGPLANSRDKDTGVGRVVRSEAFRASRRVVMKRLAPQFWADPDMRERMLAGGPAYTQTEKYRREKSASTKSKWSDPAHRDMRCAKMKAAAAKPERRAQLLSMLAEMHSDHEACSRRIRKAWETRCKWLWEFRGNTYSTCAAAEAATGVKAATIRWRILNGREGRRIAHGQAHNEKSGN